MENNQSEHEFVGSVEKLAAVVNKLDKDFTARRSWWYSFSHGLLQGVGIALGATVLFVVIFYLLAFLEGIPFFGDWSARLMDQLSVGRELIQ